MDNVQVGQKLKCILLKGSIPTRDKVDVEVLNILYTGSGEKRKVSKVQCKRMDNHFKAWVYPHYLSVSDEV